MCAKRILVIAGSDSSGGAGLEADQKVIAAHGCYAMTATTALTAQNTQGVYAVHEIPAEFLKQQIHACADDIGVDAVKIGMLASTEAVAVVGEYLRTYDVKFSVVDPVMVATSGAQLLPREAIRALREQVLPLTYLLTPNIPEARLLLQDADMEHPELIDGHDMVQLASAVQRMGPRYVLLKGGHLPLTKEHKIALEPAQRDTILDVLQGPEGDALLLRTPYLEAKNTHGTGCSLASAIVSNLVHDMGVHQAVKAASSYVEAGIRTSLDIGKGNGPINHFHSLYSLPFAPGKFIEYLLDRDDVKRPWKEYTENQFVRLLAEGTLPLARFQNHVIQDYLFLTHFSRAMALAAYKTKSMDRINDAAQSLLNMQTELRMHLTFCERFGLSKQQIESQPESQACIAYTRYVLDVGQSEDAFALQVSLLPCLIGYGVIARRLADDSSTIREGNPYWEWIETYVAEHYVTAVRKGSEQVEREATKLSRSRVEEVAQIFIQATKLETGFWEMGENHRQSG